MTTEASPSNETRERLIRSAWYSHDARWYAAVASECGIETANRLNRRIVREIGRIEARRLLRAADSEVPGGLAGLFAFIEAGRAVYVPAPLVDLTIRQIDEQSYEVVVSDCFVAQNIRLAGLGESYECAVFDRLQGWHDALGLPLTAEPPATRCALVEGRECRRVLAINPGVPVAIQQPQAGTGGLHESV